MAKSQSHTLGEFIGAFFEDLMKTPIREFAKQHNLYFDCIGDRRAREGKKVKWIDIHGSSHDLDFVIEKGGTDDVIGEPVAFIELAWRRYTRHSKNKVQEIAGAINPICAKYRLISPFKGVILCGQFTANSIEQLKSDNFHVLYIPFEKLVHAFSVNGLDINFDEDTKEADLRRKYVAVSKRNNVHTLENVRRDILELCEPEITQFIKELSIAYNRSITKICILPLHGCRSEFPNVEQAISFINNYQEIPKEHKLEYIEIIVTYNNGSIIQCHFTEKEEAIDFLKRYHN